MDGGERVECKRDHRNSMHCNLHTQDKSSAIVCMHSVRLISLIINCIQLQSTSIHCLF